MTRSFIGALSMQPARELAIMSRAILALLCKGTNIQLLADDDQALNLATNVQLSNAAPDVQEQSKQHPAANIVRRLSILRRNILWSFVILASAVIASLLLRHLYSGPDEAMPSIARRRICLFLRLGHSRQTRMDRAVLRR